MIVLKVYFQSDVLSINCPVTNDTKKIINKRPWNFSPKAQLLRIAPEEI